MEYPIKFERSPQSRIAGLVVYIFAVPAAIAGLMLLLCLLTIGTVRAIGVEDKAANLFLLVALFPTVLGTIIWAVRDFRRRAGAKIVLWPNKIEANLDGRERSLSFDDVFSVRVVGPAGHQEYRLKLNDGNSFRFPADVVYFSVVQDALQETLVPQLSERLLRQLRSGGLLFLGEGKWRSISLACAAINRLALGLLLVCSLRFARLGLERLREAVNLARQSRRGFSGGFWLGSQGIYGAPDASGEMIQWQSLAIKLYDKAGIVLASAEGSADRLFPAPYSAENFLPTSHLLTEIIDMPSIDEQRYMLHELGKMAGWDDPDMDVYDEN